MKSSFATAFAIGLAAVAVVVGCILFMQRGAHMDLPGQIKVRILSTGDNDALALVDLHITNASDYAILVRNVTVTLEKKTGEQFPRDIVSRGDAQRFFDATPASGPYHPTLYTEASIPARTTTDYTLVAQFSAPEKMLQDRKRFTVRIEEINGKSFEYTEK